MKWFKHDTDANQDAKLQNVLLDYGLEGYGLYWYCIELIAGKVDQDNITFSLEHDARIIAKGTGSTVQKVEEMMCYFVQIGLFAHVGTMITCMKLAKRLDKSMTSNPAMRAVLDSLKDSALLTKPCTNSHDSVMTQSAKPMQDKIRLDKIRLDKNKDMCAVRANELSYCTDSFEKIWAAFPAKKNKKRGLQLFLSYLKKNSFDANLVADQLIKDINKRCQLQQFGFDKMHFTTYMNGERFNDDYSKPDLSSTQIRIDNNFDMINNINFSDEDLGVNK